MRHIISLAVVCAVQSLSQVVAASVDDSIDDLMRGLTSDSFAIREKSEGALWRKGPEALAGLRKAILSEDPELALRAAELLEKTELRITPETPEEVLEAIRGFRKAPQAGKLKFLARLRSQGARYQFLKLYALEKSPQVKLMMAPVMRGVAIEGARDALVENNAEAAIDLLKMSEGGHENLMALATLYHHLGRISGETGMPPGPNDISANLWKMMVARASGEPAKALEVARENGPDSELATMEMLNGNPVKWLERNGGGNSQLEALPAYIDLAIKRWNGGILRGNDFGGLVAEMNEEDSDDRERAGSALVSLGIPEPVLERLEKENPEQAFEHYLFQERIQEALKIIGLDEKAGELEGWARTRFEALEMDEDAEEPDGINFQASLMMMARILESRGKHEILEKAYKEPMLKLAASSEGVFTPLLQQMLGGSMPSPVLALKIGSEWAGDRKERWGELLRAIVREEKFMMDSVAWLQELEPGLDHEETITVLLAFTKSIDDPDHLRAQWMKKIWKAVDAAGGDEKDKLLLRTINLAVRGWDVENSLKARDMLPPEKRSKTIWVSIDKFLSAAGRWKDAAEVLDPDASPVSADPVYHARLAVSLRRAGDEKRAAIHDEWADKLGLGQADLSVRIAELYIYGGDEKRAAKWLQRAALEADYSANSFPNVLEKYALSLLESGEFRKAAACYEALAQVNASSQPSDGGVEVRGRQRLKADLSLALSLKESDPDRARGLLEDLHSNHVVDGSLADYFFPLLRENGFEDLAARLFAVSWERFMNLLETYPDSDVTRNTASWFAARAGYELEKGKEIQTEALRGRPDEPAYLDTMAELYFSSGDRSAAVEQSNHALSFYPFTEENRADVMIRKQNDRFKNDPFPSWVAR